MDHYFIGDGATKLYIFGNDWVDTVGTVSFPTGFAWVLALYGGSFLYFSAFTIHKGSKPVDNIATGDPFWYFYTDVACGAYTLWIDNPLSTLVTSVVTTFYPFLSFEYHAAPSGGGRPV